MNSMRRFRSLLQSFHISLWIRFFSTGMILLTFLISFATSQVNAGDTDVIIGPQIDIFRGVGDQGSPFVAYDSGNRRFLVVWNVWNDVVGHIICGQFVNADGTLYGDPIQISPNNHTAQVAGIAFDPGHERFLIIWNSGNYNTNGQLVNSDGSLYGNWLPISTTMQGAAFRVAFDTHNGRFLVLMSAAAHNYGWGPYNPYVQFINSDGSLYGTPILITNYNTGYGAHYLDMAYDENNGRFLITWEHVETTSFCGRLINGDGTFFSEQIDLVDLRAMGSLTFDPINSRFLSLGGARGLLINSDGTLYRTDIDFSDFYPPWGWGTVTFDTANEKFVIGGVGEDQAPYPENRFIFGLFLNSDGSLHDPYFKISLDVYQLVDRVDIAFGETKSLVVWSGGYLDSEDQEILGSFLKLEAQAPLIYTLTTSVNPPGAGIVTLNPPSGTYNAGTAVTLTATPNSGYTFSSWSGDLTGSINPAQITMDGNKSVTAVFLLIKVEEDNPAITYTGTWNTYSSPSCSGGAMKYSGQKGAKAEFSFTGTGIKWIVTKAKMMGKAKVYLDGGYMGLVDLYSSSPAYQVVLQKAGLAPGNHTLRLEFSGQKNLRATGYYINIDAFEVIP
jgi:hypothetical protein